MFMVQSIAPIAAPSASSTRPSRSGSDASASSGRHATITAVLASITRRQPWRPASAPAIGIASSEPMPRHSSTSPRPASSSPARSLAYGTSGAQVAIVNPGMKKAARVACCCARRGSWTAKGVPANGDPTPSPAPRPRAAPEGAHRATCAFHQRGLMHMRIRYLLAAAFAAGTLALATAAAMPPPFPWPDGQRAAVSLAYDDALPSQLDNAIPALDRHGLKGTFYLTLAADTVRERMEEWRAAARSGHELGNHSLFHQCSARGAGREWVQPEQDLDAITAARMQAQVAVANTMLHAIDGSTE